MKVASIFLGFAGATAGKAFYLSPPSSTLGKSFKTEKSLKRKRQRSRKPQTDREVKNRKGEKGMKIDVTTIEGFDGMSAEEKVNALLGVDLPDSSNEIEKLKASLNKATSEASEWKKKHNALLSEDQRKSEEENEAMTALKEELETLRKEKTVSNFTAKLLENGFAKEEASKGAQLLAEGNIDAFFGTLSTYKGNLEKSIKSELLKNNPVPDSHGGTDSIMTREKFNKLSLHEKMVFMNDHPEDYEAMKK